MKVVNKKYILALILPGCILCGYFLWLLLRPIEIIAVHKNGSHSYVLVKNFPFTDNGKISWWLKNKDSLKNQYDIPNPAPYGSFTVVFWDFGGGYKEHGKYDRLCFDDMNPPINCIEKNKIFSVSNSKNMGLTFITNNKIYRMKKNGEMVKTKYE
ncbi:DUF943 family protein [Enterobacteriaceae bacterium H20N1]|uniref:DUF943 family protein n=1 Tax=Dryocola boscaweniae TaxID=2925397 RepID=A0A9X2W949_9ENTR|nr:DUF943 family protein [Dryocola boscaweniae]MCT4702507.1 DUF943 family protein [Dryocola boscaweniae]MCT4716456.1 DUF943 family protein [Dryocola boscaweniae]MCT4719675.1 DUF943 family protein [Dryocola boscaweniae]